MSYPGSVPRAAMRLTSTFRAKSSVLRIRRLSTCVSRSGTARVSVARACNPRGRSAPAARVPLGSAVFASVSASTAVSFDTIPTLKDWQVSASVTEHGPFSHSPLAARISVYQGDITELKVDAIVNAANESLLPGGGVCGAIHKAAGPELAAACVPFGHCATGNAVLTDGFALPAKHVIHTVGPRGERPPFLESAYVSCLRLCKDNGIETIAFPCVSTGIFGYPQEHAAEVAVETVLAWLAEHDMPKRVVFCVFGTDDLEIYQRMLPTKVTLWPEISARRSQLHLDDHQDQLAFPTAAAGQTGELVSNERKLS